MNKSDMSKLHRFFNFCLYWFHILFMTAFFFSGFFLPLSWVVLIYVLLELQLIIFDGCSLTKLQQKVNSLATDQDFIPVLMKRFFRVKITDKQHELISYVIMAFPVFVGIIRAWID